MSESRSLLLETAERLFAGLSDTAPFTSSWREVATAGLPSLLVAENRDGFGGDWGDAFAVLRCAGSHAAPLPVGEAIVAARLAADAGLELDAGLATIASRAAGEVDAKGRFAGHIASVPWGREPAQVVFDLGEQIVCAKTADARSIERRSSPAGEARDTLIFEGAAVQCAERRMSVLEAGAFVRGAQIAGALDATLALSIQHANQRIQFGKPIGTFQAVQQSLAVFTEEAAAVNCAGQAAAEATDRGDAGFEIAAAKLRANMAAAVGVATAHQVHGAIGFTQEHTLHRFTRRLITWRSEFGSERFWAEQIGRGVCGRGADALWPFLTARGDTGLRGRSK
ncbi:MAG: acyl-CoA dehydrogenase family protein [Hyphomonadaceae bacterium]